MTYRDPYKVHLSIGRQNWISIMEVDGVEVLKI